MTNPMLEDVENGADFAWPGGYPLFGVCADGGCLCPSCIRENSEEIKWANSHAGCDQQWEVVGIDSNFEDQNLVCDHCSRQIKAAYEP